MHVLNVLLLLLLLLLLLQLAAMGDGCAALAMHRLYQHTYVICILLSDSVLLSLLLLLQLAAGENCSLPSAVHWLCRLSS
jgi:hypothetical protein